MKFAVPVCVLTGVLASVEDSFATDQTQPLDPIIISSSRIPTKLGYSITNVVVIDRQIIEASRASSVTEVLRYQAGIHVQQSGSRGAVSSIFLRNNDPNYVAVIIDGVKVNDPTNSRGGSFDFSSIDINSVERIEIVKGAMSSMHGSDALAGVIYITTRPVSDSGETQLSLTSGTNSYKEASAQVRKKLADTDVSMNVAYLDEGEQTEFSGFINRSVNVNTDSFVDSGKKLSFRGRYNESDAESLPDDSGGEDFAVLREVDQRDIHESSLGLAYNQDVTAEWSYTIEASNFVHDEDVVSPGVESSPGVVAIPPNTSNSEYKRNYAIWNNNIELNSNLQLSVGLDKQWEEGISFGTQNSMFGPPSGSYSLKRQNQGFFIETLYGAAENFTIKLSVRYDDHQHASSQTTGNLGFRYRKGSYVYTASTGTGYKLPSFFALGNFLVGNPDLVSEESEYWEVGIKQVSLNQHAQWHFNIYAYEFENLVDYDSATFSMVNRDEVTSEGVEIGTNYYLNKNNAVSIELNYSETEIVGSDVKLRNRPRWRATGQYQHYFSNALSSLVSLLYVDEVHESSIPTGNLVLDSYYRIDISANWQSSRVWIFGASIENLTDQDYQEIVGTDSPGISARLSVMAKY